MDTIESLQDNMNNDVRKCVKKALKLRDCQKICANVFQERTISQLSRIVAEAQISEIDEKMYLSSEELRKAKVELDNANKLLKQLKNNAKASLESLNAFKQSCVVDQNAENLLPIFDENIEETIDQLEESLAQHQARAEVAQELDPRILSEYNARKNEIEDLEKRCQEKILQVDELRASFQHTRETWLEKLSCVVETISTSFSSAFSSTKTFNYRYWLRWGSENQSGG